MNKNSRLVYSTDSGRIKQPSSPSSSITPTDGIVRIHRETKGRKGKGVSLIKGLTLSDAELKNIAKHLKQKIGVGGSVKNAIIEIQTNDREIIKTLLEKEGHTVKISGS
jgi:translation initiation factor 1